MPRLDWRLALKAFAGFLAGLALWVLLTPSYDRVIAASAEKVIRVFEKPPVTRLTRKDDGYTTVDRTDFDRRSTRRPAMPIKDLTFNIILLTALFAASKRVFSDRNIGGFLIAAVILALTHILGTIAEVMSIYVAKLGMWSTVNYTEFERNFWGVANHSYRLVLMYAFAFALWWAFRDKSENVEKAAARRPRQKRGK